MRLAGARIGGDLVFSGARIAQRPSPTRPEEAAEGSRAPVLPARDRRRRSVPSSPTGCASRATWSSTTACAPPARSGCPTRSVGGYLRLSGARLDGPQGASDRGIALLADGMEVGGDVEGRDNGRGALLLRRAGAAGRRARARHREPVRRHARRARTATRCSPTGCASAASSTCAGSGVRGRCGCRTLDVGATLDCTGAVLDPAAAASGRHDAALAGPRARRRSARTCCASSGFVAAGGVRVAGHGGARSPPSSSTRGWAPRPRRPATRSTLYGLVTTDLVVEPAVAPGGAVRLTQARVASFSDSPLLWDAQGGFLIDGFDYQLMNDAGPTCASGWRGSSGPCPTTRRAPTTSSRRPTGGPGTTSGPSAC